MSRWKTALVIIVASLLSLLGWRQLHKPAASTRAVAAPIPVTAVDVEQRNVPVYLDALGTVQALNTVTVRPQVGGQLVAIEFREGQEVRKGDVIARIDPRSYQAALDQALAKQKQDEAQVSASRSTLRRYEDLIKQHFIAAQDLENQRQTVSQQESLIAADAAAVETARIQLGYTTVRAPIDGLTGIRTVDVGNIVQANDATGIVTLTQTHPINVLFTLPEQNLDLVRGYGEDELSVIAMDRVDSHVIADDGALRVIDNQIDTSTGTFRLKSEFPNAKNVLWPGQFVNVRLRVNTVQGGLVIPTQAVQRGPDGDYVYVVAAADAPPAGADPASASGKSGADAKPGSAGARSGGAHAPAQTVRMQPVKVGGEAGDSHVLISSGLAAGDRVVTEGQFRLKPGARVIALKPGEAPPPPSAEELSAAKNTAGGGRRGR